MLLRGTSTGGPVALQLAMDRPDLVRALVVVASAHQLDPPGAGRTCDLRIMSEVRRF
jgi:pimeloyl-ACP methyl ester carboxylesterase